VAARFGETKETLMASETFSELVLRLTPRLKAAPSVTVEQYRAIECNRCGACCYDIPAPFTPDELAALLAGGTLAADRQRFYAGLEPVEPLVKGWRYRCVHFRREPDGLGTCTIHDQRPQICRGYPYGGAVRRWSQCAWYVQIQDADGNVIPVAPSTID
jgi:Fe-S-cluster containining protein